MKNKMISSSTIQTGFLFLNKPKGPTSHDSIDRVRGVTGVKRIGHAGTLDPFAEGLLVVGIGREATKLLDRFKRFDKTYRAVMQFGAVSDTYDRTGEIRSIHCEQRATERELNEILGHFRGTIQQIPPMFSAKKVRGVRLYRLARKGEVIARKPVNVVIASLQLLSFHENVATIEVTCSTGTYIRSLVHDIGQRLGCGAYVQELTRTAVGPYRLEDSVALEELTSLNWTTWVRPLSLASTISNP